MKFNEIVLSNETLTALEELNFEQMMPIQEKAIPLILEGHDVIGQAQTGTGKTAAFGIPIIENTTFKNKGVEHIILAPTRELAVQIVDELKRISKYHNLKIATIIGGVDYSKQIKMFRDRPHIIVATPGRIIDHLKNKKISLENIKTFIIDEADEMLKTGFKEEIDEIITFLPEKRQALLFSATINKNVKRIVENLMTRPKEVLVSSGLATTKNIKQYCIVVKEKNKFSTLTKILDIKGDELSIIFGRTRRRVDELSSALNASGYNARGLHGDLSQKQRLAIMKEYRAGGFNILVATDVAARGLDISNIQYVYNFDLPQEIEYYVHRIGRSGRAGQKGVSISFARESELPHIERIKKESKSDIKVIDPPTMNDVRKARQALVIDNLTDIVENVELNKHFGLARTLIDEYGAQLVVSAAIDALSGKSEFVPADLTGEPPVRIRHDQRKKTSSKDFSGKSGSRGGRRRRRKRKPNSSDKKGSR